MPGTAIMAERPAPVPRLIPKLSRQARMPGAPPLTLFPLNRIGP